MNAKPVASVADDRRLPAGPAPVDATCAGTWGPLLDRIAKCDAGAWGTFYDESSGLAFSLIVYILQDREAAEDALLDLYLDIRKRAQRYEHRDQDPLSWVIALARRAAWTRLRKNRRSKHANPSPSLVLAELSEQQRSILQLTYFGGLTAREAAHQLRLPLQHVTAEIQSALCALRRWKEPEPTC